MALIDFGGEKEKVVTRKEFTLEKARKVLRKETVAVIGYGVQGPAQALNMKDNGIRVIIGQSREYKKDWDRAVKDGWVPGTTLFPIEEAVRKGTIIQMLVSDAAQRTIWPTVKKALKPGDALYFSHGFSIVYKEQTKVIPPKNVDVIMVAPKGSGTSVRRNFLSGAGINSSFAVFQVSVPYYLPERGVERPHRRTRCADGCAGRGHAGAVRRASQKRSFALRSVQ
jgi:ketol-acid reductoisomerase